MVDPHTGNVQPELDQCEHNHTARARRSLLVGLEDDGSTYITPTVFDYTNSDPLAVVLVQPTSGTAYTATASGGGGAAGINPATTALYTAMQVTASAVQVLPSNADRTHFVLDSQRGATTIKIYWGHDSSVTPSNGGRELEPGEAYDEMGMGIYTGDIYAVSATGTVTLTIQEFWAP